ncbi:hypothetical protein [Paraburkholderia phenoliruptrix]|uniref:hypothetical protein n=1 Tax=Paraburkholderia phenoliruptrix TaxID=252970 RepID=UPI0012EE60EA
MKVDIHGRRSSCTMNDNNIIGQRAGGRRIKKDLFVEDERNALPFYSFLDPADCRCNAIKKPRCVIRSGVAFQRTLRRLI